MGNIDMQSIDVDKLLRDLGDGWGMPSSHHIDPDVFKYEMAAIFNRSWLFFAPVHHLCKKGDTKTGWAGDVPVLVTRDQTGKLHGFVNMCRHRGYAVATKDKNCRNLVCQYHAWTYNLDGSLRNAPNTDDDAGFDKSELSLLPISVDEFGPGIFVNADPGAKPLRESHPRLQSYAESMEFRTDPGFYLDNYELVRTVHYDFESNWKLWYDNNTECYHCPTIHAGSFASAFSTNQDSMRFSEVDQFMTFSFDPMGEEHVKGELKAKWQRALQIFPAIGITMQDDILLVYQALPTGPETTKKTMYCLVRKEGDKELASRWIDLWHQTFSEDQLATQIQQTGIRSGRLPRPRYVRSQEGPVLFVNRLILNAYRGAGTPAPAGYTT